MRTALLAIAAQCPYSGGDAVFKARALCALFDDTIYDNKVICAEQGIMWRTKPKTAKTPLSLGEGLGVRLYPNPTSSQTTLFLEGTHTDLKLELYDMLGREITTQTISANTNQTTLSFEGNAAGLYILSLRNAAGSIIQQQKVSLIK